MDRYAVIGNPVAHSLSPEIHTLFASQCEQNLRYETLLAPADGFRASVEQFMAWGGRGLNVTLPFKQEARTLSHAVSARAERAGAVNTLSFEGQVIKGDNTDGAGLIQDLRHNRRIPLHDIRILILGAGGAVRGVLGPLLDSGPAHVLIANRTVSRASELAHAFRDAGPVAACALVEIPAQPVDLIINAISSGLGGQGVDLPKATVGSETCCYDMLYARSQATPFVRWAREQGAALAADGLGMLVEQAAESFYIWRGMRPDTAPVLRHLRQTAAA